MTVRTSKPLSISLAVVGGLLLLTGLLTTSPLNVVVGILLVIVGALMTVNPMIVFADGEVQQRSPLGFTLKRHPISGPADLHLEGSRLVHVPTGKKITSLGFGIDKSDAAAVRAWVEGAPPR